MTLIHEVHIDNFYMTSVLFHGQSCFDNLLVLIVGFSCKLQGQAILNISYSWPATTWQLSNVQSLEQSLSSLMTLHFSHKIFLNRRRCFLVLFPVLSQEGANFDFGWHHFIILPLINQISRHNSLYESFQLITLVFQILKSRK